MRGDKSAATPTSTRRRGVRDRRGHVLALATTEGDPMMKFEAASYARAAQRLRRRSSAPGPIDRPLPFKITPKIQAAIAAWVAADKAYCAAIRKRGSGPARTKELRRLDADRLLAAHVEYYARERLIAILNPDDHRDE